MQNSNESSRLLNLGSENTSKSSKQESKQTPVPTLTTTSNDVTMLDESNRKLFYLVMKPLLMAGVFAALGGTNYKFKMFTPHDHTASLLVNFLVLPIVGLIVGCCALCCKPSGGGSLRAPYIPL